MATSVHGIVQSGDLQPGQHLIDGRSLNIALYPQSTRSNLTALAGGGATGATQLMPGLNQVDVVGTAADSCGLPQALAGLSVAVYNATAGTSLTVWPQQSNPNNTAGAADVITNLAGGNVLSLACPANSVQFFRCFKAGIWKATV